MAFNTFRDYKTVIPILRDRGVSLNNRLIVPVAYSGECTRDPCINYTQIGKISLDKKEQGDLFNK